MAGSNVFGRRGKGLQHWRYWKGVLVSEIDFNDLQKGECVQEEACCFAVYRLYLWVPWRNFEGGVHRIELTRALF